MSTFSDDPQNPGSPPPAQPLTSSTAAGKSYKRSPTVQTEIDRMLCLPHSDWIAEAEDLQNETLVFLIRQSLRGDPELYGRLFQELSKRITRIARRSTRGLDRATMQEIVLKVEIDMLELAVSEKPSRKRDFLEIAFVQAVEGWTFDRIRKHRNSPLGHLGDILADPTDEDGDEIERPIELAPDGRPDPEAILLALEDEDRRKKLFKTACDAPVKDPRHREAVLAHYVDGLQITSKDPDKLDLERRLQARPAQIKYRISAGLKAMRKALKAEPRGEEQ